MNSYETLPPSDPRCIFSLDLVTFMYTLIIRHDEPRWILVGDHF